MSNFLKKRKVANWLKLAISLFSLIILILSGFILEYVFAQAELSINPTQKQTNVETSFQVSPSFDQDQPGELKGKITTFEDQLSAEFTDINPKRIDSHSSGVITINNDLEQGVNLLKNNRLEAENGQIFILDETVFVSGLNSIQTTVTSQDIGEITNIGPTRFELLDIFDNSKKYISAFSTDHMQGGYILKKTVSKEDLENAKTELSARLEEKLKQQAQLDNRSIYFQNTEILDSFSNIEEGAEVDSFSYSIRQRLILVEPDTKAWQEFAKKELASSIKSDWSISQIAGFEIKIDQVDFSNQIASLTGSINGMVQPQLEAIGLSVNLLQNKNVKELNSELSNNALIQSFVIKLKPFFAKQLPPNGKNIKVQLDSN